MSRHRHFDPSRLLGEGNDSHESLPSSRLPSNRLTHSSHDATRLARLLAAEGKEDESDLLAVVRVFRRRWRTAARFAAIIMAVTALVTLFTTPLYAPDVRIEIGPPGSEAFSIIHDDLAASDNDYVETQVLNLLSESLAIATIRELHLDQNPEFIAPRHVSLLGWLTPRRRHETASQNPDELQLTPQESRALEFFKRQL
ncbi:MAG TPA: Wzz/FepE/Etk N-terminal domain-containing protein, partial [Terriglobales bacterium]|nr:Wzz/FepE/Etk N-terminal domain-containing protein [Terriglobales bacterium]